jgi:hypothetical protein
VLARNVVHLAAGLLPVYATNKIPRPNKVHLYIRRHALHKYSRKFRVPRADLTVYPIGNVDNVFLILPKKTVLSQSLRECVLIDMFEQLSDTMARNSCGECPPTPGVPVPIDG